MNLKRFLAVVKARNIEFFRDKSSLGWSLAFPILLLVGMSFVFSGDGKAAYKIGVMNLTTVESEFIETRFISFVDYQDIELAKTKLSQHSLDMVIDFSAQQYWVNQQAPNGYLAEKIFLASHQNFEQLTTEGKKIRYVDWLRPHPINKLAHRFG